MMNQTMKDRIFELNDDTLAEIECSHVYQVWQDGEITLTKCGSLLGQRRLHMLEPPHASAKIGAENFPHQSGANGFAYVTEEGAEEIRCMILELDPNPEL